MTIRMRFIVSFTAALVLTVGLFAAAGLLVIVAVTGDVRGAVHYLTSQYMVKPLTQQEENVYLDLKYVAKHQPEPAEMVDESLLIPAETALAPVQAGILIRRDNQVVYTSSIINTPPDLTAVLPAYEMGNIQVRDVLSTNGRFFTYVKFDFQYADQTPGSVYVMKEANPYGIITRQLFPLLIGVLLVMLVLTSALLYLDVSQRIIRPLQALREAADRIKNGDLNFRLQTQRKDELGELYTAFEDMRERLKRSVELQLQYEDNRKELISHISHDLKTPLTAIKGYVEGIRDGVASTPEKLSIYINTIHRKTSNMDQLIDELFLYSKLDMKQLRFAFEELELGRFVQQIAAEHKLDLAQHHIPVEYSNSAGGPVRVLADAEKLRRVIGNILANSAKFMDKAEPRIEINLFVGEAEGQKNDPDDLEHGKSGMAAIVTITDNGPGIPEAALPQIFERFYRAEPSRNVQSGGSGLGLAIAKQLIEGHGGSIWARNAEGQGTTIGFSLPLLSPDTKHESRDNA